MKPDNIKLNYKVRIYYKGDTVFTAPSVEVFLDEHGFQWAKFIARNGYAQGKEHMIRTDQVVIIKDEL